jgi:hypothetical protein
MSDKEETLLKILSNLHGKAVGDLADQIMTLFKEPERWKPTQGERYWMIQNDGAVESYLYTDDTYDENKWRFGNCFRTRDHATVARDKIKDLLLHFHKTHNE